MEGMSLWRMSLWRGCHCGGCHCGGDVIVHACVNGVAKC